MAAWRDFCRRGTALVLSMAVGQAIATPLMTYEQRLVAAAGEPGDQLGGAVSVNGDTVLLGAPFDDVAGVIDNGSAEVRVRRAGTWVEQATLVPSDLGESKSFGISVDIDGNRALVGAVGDGTNGPSGGAAYVFERTGQAWAQTAKLVPADGGGDAIVGWSVAVHGNTAVLGAPLHDVPMVDVGAVYVFEHAGDTWNQVQKLQAPSPDFQDRFGVSVAIDGDQIVVGALGDDDLGVDAGAAYVYARTGGTWVLEKKLLSFDGAAHDYAGISVDVSGETAIVGARKDDDKGIDSGSAYVYVRSGGAWPLQQKLLASDGKALDDFGYAVAIAGDLAFIGAYFSDDRGEQSGSAYAYVRNGGTWLEAEKVVPSDLQAGDEYAGAVAAGEHFVVAGARFQSSNGPGAAYVHETLPRCSVRMDVDTYADGEQVIVDSLRLLVSSRAPVPVEWKVWLSRPGEPPASLIDFGAGGWLVLPAGFDLELGPLPLMSVTAADPRGGYRLGCRFLVPATGEEASFEAATFEVR